MKIGSISENKQFEKRIAITPEIAKKYINLGFEVNLVTNYGSHLGFNDNQYRDLGVKIISDEKELIHNSDLIIQLNLLENEKIALIKKNQTLVGIFNPYKNKEKIDLLSKNKINVFSLELLPRISRAQSMDILSSQANLAGYKAVIESFASFEKAIPMMMTAAGTIPAAKVLVVGAGVAGLQAIATAKRMGAIVFATDVRMASKEQVESLGGKFLTIEGAENLETEGGYAKEASEDFKKKQEELLIETLKKIVDDHPHTEEDLTVWFSGFGDFSLNVSCTYYINKTGHWANTPSEINMLILEKFNAEKLDFAFPTQTIITQS